MPDIVVGEVSLHGAARLVFSVGSWRGRNLAGIRKFVTTGRHDGPTKSGMALQGEVLLRVIEALTRLQTEVSGIGEREFARIPKTGPKEIIISTVPPEDPQALPGVDVREFLNTPRYTGPTKKGIRFPWDKLPEVMGLMQIQAQRLGAQEQQNQPPTLFPLNRPLWVDQVEAARQPSPSEIDPVLGKLFSDGPKKFPEDFLTGQEGDLIEVRLPSDPLEVVSTRDGKYEVRSPRGFCYSVRNPVEGNYLCYAGLCGERVIYLPQKMLSVFKVVTSYKKYLREQGQSLIQEYERKCGHRPLALHKAKEAFRRFGLPWIPE